MWNPSLVDGPIGVPDTLGEDGSVTSWVPGYHLNIAPASMSAELERYRVHPVTPARVWAGDALEWTTVFLRFADESEARSCLPHLWNEPEED